MADEQFTRQELERLAETLWSKVARASEAECWPWMGKRSTEGYGSVRLAVGTTGAHRAAYAISNDSALLRSQVVMHKCDNPCCCNPLHLVAGTQADNIADRVAKGRSAIGRKPNPAVAKNPPTRDDSQLTIQPRSSRTASQILASLMNKKRLKRQALKASM